MDATEVKRIASLLVSKGFGQKEAEVVAHLFSYDTIAAMGAEELLALQLKARQMLDRASLQEAGASKVKTYLQAQGLTAEETDTLISGGFSLETLKNLTKDRLQSLANRYKDRVSKEIASYATKYGIDTSAFKYGNDAYKLAMAMVKFDESMVASAMTTYPDWSSDSGRDPALERFNSVMDARATIAEEKRKFEDDSIRTLFGEVAALGVFGGPAGWIIGGLLYGFGEFAIWTKNKFMPGFNTKEDVEAVKSLAQALFREFGMVPPDSGYYLNVANFRSAIEATLADYRRTLGTLKDFPKCDNCGFGIPYLYRDTPRWIPMPLRRFSAVFEQADWQPKWAEVSEWAASTDDSVVVDLVSVGYYPLSYLDIQGSDPFIPCVGVGGSTGSVTSCPAPHFMPGEKVSPLTPAFGTETVKRDGEDVRIRSLEPALSKMEDAALAIGTIVARFHGRDHGPVAEATLRALRMSLVRQVISKEDIADAEANIRFVQSLDAATDDQKRAYVDRTHKMLNDWRDGFGVGRIVDPIYPNPYRLRLLVTVALHEVGAIKLSYDSMEIIDSGVVPKLEGKLITV